MDGTPQPPQSPAPLASMCRDRWKTFLHASQIGIRPDRIRRNFPCGRALAFRICPLQCVVWMPGRGRFGGKRWTPVADLVFLRTPISLIKMQSTASFADASFVHCCSAIVRYARTASRNRSAAALRNLRDRHGQDRKAAPDRIAPARLRLQVRRLQPDHVGRAGAAGRSAPPPPGVGAAPAALVPPPLKTHFPHAGPGFFLAMPHVKLRPNFSQKKRQGHVRGLH
jgi:hypothetical protein